MWWGAGLGSICAAPGRGAHRGLLWCFSGLGAHWDPGCCVTELWAALGRTQGAEVALGCPIPREGSEPPPVAHSPQHGWQ